MRPSYGAGRDRQRGERRSIPELTGNLRTRVRRRRRQSLHLLLGAGNADLVIDARGASDRDRDLIATPQMARLQKHVHGEMGECLRDRVDDHPRQIPDVPVSGVDPGADPEPLVGAQARAIRRQVRSHAAVLALIDELLTIGQPDQPASDPASFEQAAEASFSHRLFPVGEVGGSDRLDRSRAFRSFRQRSCSPPRLGVPGPLVRHSSYTARVPGVWDATRWPSDDDAMSEHDLDDERRRLERKMADFEKEEEQTKREIEAELRQEHWGLDPPRPLEWEQPALEER